MPLRPDFVNPHLSSEGLATSLAARLAEAVLERSDPVAEDSYSELAVPFRGYRFTLAIGVM